MSNLLNNVNIKGNPIAVISSDWHIALNAWKKHPEIKGDAAFSLSQIVDICLSLNVPMLAAGDLFDIKNPDSYTVNTTAHHMQRLAKSNLPVYYVQGQHEMACPPWFSLFSNCTHVHDKEFQIGKIKFYGYDYFLPKSEEDSYQRFKPADVLVTHQVWSELLPRHGQSFCCSYIKIAQELNYKAIISGDFHSHFKETAEGTKCVFVSPGSICLQDMNEPPIKAVWIITDNLEFVSVPIKSRRIIQTAVLSENDLNTVVAMADTISNDELPDGIGVPILRVKFNTDIKNVFAAISSAYKGKAHLDFKPLVVESDEFSIELPDSIPTASADEAFCESLNAYFPSKDRGINDIIRIWKTNSLDDLRKEIDTISNEVKTS